jgi:hypothetical protein
LGSLRDDGGIMNNKATKEPRFRVEMPVGGSGVQVPADSRLSFLCFFVVQSMNLHATGIMNNKATKEQRFRVEIPVDGNGFRFQKILA